MQPENPHGGNADNAKNRTHPLHAPCAASLQMLLSLLHSRTASAFFQGTAVRTLVRQASPRSRTGLNGIYGTVVPLALAPHPAALSFFFEWVTSACLESEKEMLDTI